MSQCILLPLLQSKTTLEESVLYQTNYTSYNAHQAGLQDIIVLQKLSTSLAGYSVAQRRGVAVSFLNSLLFFNCTILLLLILIIEWRLLGHPSRLISFTGGHKLVGVFVQAEWSNILHKLAVQSLVLY